MLVTDPADKHVRIAQQAGFVDKMRQAGRAIPEFMVEATDEEHHGVVVYSELVAADCVLGKTVAEIARTVGTVVRRIASTMRAAPARQLSSRVRRPPLPAPWLPAAPMPAAGAGAAPGGGV